MRVRYQRTAWTHDVALPPWPLDEQCGVLKLAVAFGLEACILYIVAVASEIRSALVVRAARREATPSQDAGDGSPTTRGGDRQA